RGARWARNVSLGEHHVRRILVPASKFRSAIKTFSLGEELFAGRGIARWAS
ncbi:hypothetical protein A2U01_0107647, partial [Trifolium medium]|nr:hypothetical protein [Trifolium medium]